MTDPETSEVDHETHEPLSKPGQSGTEGIEPHPALIPLPGDHVVTKHRYLS